MLRLLLITIILTSEKCLGGSPEPQSQPQHEVRIRQKHPLPEKNRHLLKTLRYTKPSKAKNGDDCMTDCVDNYCLTEKEEIETCDVITTLNMYPVITFYTASAFENKHTCYSKCIKGTKDYWWCYVDESRYWDYCNPSTEKTMAVHFFGKTMTHYGYSMPCKNACAKYNEDYYWCKLMNDAWDKCDPDDPIYYQHLWHTANHDLPCIGVCDKHLGTAHSWCYIDTNNKWDYCAQYADDFTSCEKCNSLKTFRNHGVRDYINEMENNSSNTRVPINNPNTAIFSYTYRQLPNGIRLPLVVRARIAQSDIRATNTRRSDSISPDAKRNCRSMGMNTQHPEGNNDVFGHLVAFKNGGSADFFNIVPQPQSLNIGKLTGSLISPSVWSATEREITNFARDLNGIVELSIGIYYDDNSTRPIAIGTYERYLGTSSSTHCEYKYSNDPDDDDC